MAHNAIISTSLPYSSGEITLLPNTDTVSFSNGIKVFSMQFIAPANVPEYKTYYCAINFQLLSGAAYYKYNSGLSSNYLGNRSSPVLETGAADAQYVKGNSDTNWGFANHIPLVTFPSDSIFKLESASNLSGYNGKVLFSHYNEDIWSSCDKSILFSEYNSIVYFIPSIPGKSAMKIQANSFVLDTSAHLLPSLEYCKEDIVAHIIIRWAIDSLGNGSFKETTGIQKPSQSPQSPIIRKKSSFLKINNTKNSHLLIQDDLFNAQGRHFSKPSNLKTDGIFFKLQQ